MGGIGNGSNLTRVAWIVVLTACGECGRAEMAPDPWLSGRESEVTRGAPRQDGLYLYSAQRCGECHGDIHQQWSGSAHARAATSPLYIAMRQDAGAENCDRCHAPLRPIVGDNDRLAQEGVSCEVCHTIANVEVADGGAQWRLELNDNRRYGPICDAVDHYFHKVACSPLHTRAEFCASCHLLQQSLPSGDRLPVFTEYEEWQSGPYAENGTACQDCHMPSRRGRAAVGAAVRDGVSNHGFLGSGRRSRRRAYRLAASVVRTAESLVVRVRLENLSGHAMPAGLPGRQIVVSAFALNADGQVVDESSTTLQRRLVDEDDAEVPFYRAMAVGKDDRLAVDESRRIEFLIRRHEVDRVRVEVWWHELSSDLSRFFPEVEPGRELVARTSVAVVPTGTASRRPHSNPGNEP